LVREQSSLLILDGVEPLQNRTVIDGGRLKDNGLYALLRDVERHGLGENSLVVVSSRQSLVELDKCLSYQSVDLLRFSTADGIMLLKSLQVEGLPHEFVMAVEAYGGHALALVLLGNLLVEYFDGDVNQHERLPILEESENVVAGHHAERVMNFYEEQWASYAPERRFLNLLGLFDRPMDKVAMEALFVKAEVAEPLVKLSTMQWKKMLAHLRKMGLLLEKKGDFGEESYDTHPLIRSYFGKQIQEHNPSIWKQTHLVLFEYFQTVPEKQQPDTLEELEPLYRAVVHGCLAGEYQKAFDIYRKRIERDDEHYSTKKLGGYAQDLTAITPFFPENWKKTISSALSEVEQGLLLAYGSFYLVSLGRLVEAVEPRQTAIKLFNELEDWKEAALSTRNLTFLLMFIGKLDEARKNALEYIIYAKNAEDTFEQIISHVTLATILHRQGSLKSASKHFKMAEKIKNSQLSSWEGAYYSILTQVATYKS